METKRRPDALSRERDRSSKQAPKEDKTPKYTVYVRLPFKRGDFVDPPPVNWDEKKSAELWSIISDTSRANHNWNELASSFNVGLEFILQMSSYLAERHASQLRAQMIKVAASTARGSNTQSPIPGSEPPSHAFASEAMKRTGSARGNRPGSALSMRSQTQPGPSLPNNEPAYGRVSGAGPPTRAATTTTIPVRPTVSRNSSSGTTVPTQNTVGNTTANNRPTTAVTRLNEHQSQRRRISFFSTQQPSPRLAKQGDAGPASPGPASSSSDEGGEDSSSDDSPVQSRIIRRPPFSSHHRGAGTNFDGVDEEEPEAAFLPFAAPNVAGSASTSNQDMTSTLRGNLNLRNLVGVRGGASFAQASRSQTSEDSSGSSAAIIEQPQRETRSNFARHGGAGNRYPGGGYGGPPGGHLSPRITDEAKRKGGLRDMGSDGTGSRSMGSSFSDLDDASVTRSAMEEALASGMQDTTLASRMRHGANSGTDQESIYAKVESLDGITRSSLPEVQETEACKISKLGLAGKNSTGPPAGVGNLSR